MATKQADNRFKHVKYNETKYGASTLSAEAIAWGFEVDWAGVGAFTSGNDAERMVTVQGFRGRHSFIKPDGSGFETMEIGTYVVLLDNYDGRYDSWNASSPLFPNVTPGKECRIRVRDRRGTSTYSIFRGIVQDIVPEYGDGSNPQVRLVCQDAWSYLRSNGARIPISSALSVDRAMNLMLNAVMWPTRWGRDIDASSDILTYFWSTADKKAGSVLEDLAYAGAGFPYIDNTGRFAFKFRATVPTPSLALTESDLLKDVRPSQPWENYRNVVRFIAHPLTLASSGIIWQLSGNTPSIQNGGTLTFWAGYTYQNVPVPATAVLQPVATTDFTTNTLPDGSGTDTTAECTFTVYDYGQSAYCVIQNNHAGTVYLTKAQIKGQAIYVVNTAEATYPKNPAVIASPRVFSQDSQWLQDVNIGVSLVQVLGPFFLANTPMIPVLIQGRPDIQFIPDLGDLVSLDLPSRGLAAGVYRVGGIGNESQDEGCQDIVTSLFLEPYPTVGTPGVYDTAVYDTDTYGW